jgi:hypothetical protein
VADQFKAGRAAMMLNGPWNIPSLSQEKDLNWGTATFPVNKEGQASVAPLGGEAWTVPVTGDDAKQAKAAEFVKCLNSDDVAMQFAKDRSVIPTNLELAKKYAAEVPEMSAFATQVATACGYVLGAELRACGVDFSFTPVLDLDWGESGVIGDRAFGRDPRVVTLLAKSLMHGLLQAGVANCGKHFPGHGFVKADSHTDIPVDRRSLKAILADDAAPYGWLNTVLTSVMPAHVIYPKVDRRPAGFSSRWLNDILRRQPGFSGSGPCSKISSGRRAIKSRVRRSFSWFRRSPWPG